MLTAEPQRRYGAEADTLQYPGYASNRPIDREVISLIPLRRRDAVPLRQRRRQSQ